MENNSVANGTALPAMRRIIEEDAIGQLRRQDGRMAQLGSEGGELKLDWVEGLARLLADKTKLEEVEAEAHAIWQKGIRHILWAGMGGSVITVRVLTELGFCCSEQEQGITIYPLDSTDPAALNEIVRKIAQAKQVGAQLIAPLLEQEATDPHYLSALLDDVMMVGVSMGMTSEEPITHLTWFADLLEQAGLSPAEHLLVMTLPGSYLDVFAHEHAVPSRPLQLDGGTGTGGRMSAPTTRVFLLPAALAFAHLPEASGTLREIVRRAWHDYDLDLATQQPAQHPFVQLAAELSTINKQGACYLLLNMPEGWSPLIQWIEQLMEESLGKGGKGIVVFDDQPLQDLGSRAIARIAPYYDTAGEQFITPLPRTNTSPQTSNIYALFQPYLANKEPQDKLAALATSFLGWQLTMALYGYLNDITFAGQPAVENYKARARVLRNQDNPLQVIQEWQPVITKGPLTLLSPKGIEMDDNPASVFAALLRHFSSTTEDHFGYLDLTINGEIPPAFFAQVGSQLRLLGNSRLHMPVKLRQAPAAYHSTEQSEMDGPPQLVSLRILARHHEQSLVGTYNDTFLQAQAISTWQAMLEQGRNCLLMLLDSTMNDAIELLQSFFQDVEHDVAIDKEP